MLTGILAGLAAGALWGLGFVSPRMLPDGTGAYSSVDMTAGRFAVYGLVSVLAMLLGRLRRAPARRMTWPTPRQAGAALGMSVLGFSAYYLLLVLAIRDAGSEVPSLVIGTIPIWVMLLGKPQGLRWVTLIPGLVLTLGGLLLMMASVQGGHGGVAAPVGAHFWRGMLLVGGSLVSWTIFAVLNAAWLKRHPDVNATDWANWLGVATGLGAVAMWWAAGSNLRLLSARADFGVFVLLAVVTGVGAAWLATILWNIASQRLSASLCGQLIVSETLFALAYSFAWDRHWPAATQLAACVLFTLGIVASIRAHR